MSAVTTMERLGDSNVLRLPGNHATWQGRSPCRVGCFSNSQLNKTMEQHSEIDENEPVDDTLTQIVSYLDGELDETQMNAFERDLINDPQMRSHADILSRTWGMLDSLEEVSASTNFTQGTLATISAEVADTQSQLQQQPGRLVAALVRYRIVPSFLIGLLAASIGLGISQRVQERRERKGDAAVTKMALQNLDMLSQIELYNLVPDANQLKELQLAEPLKEAEKQASEVVGGVQP